MNLANKLTMMRIILVPIFLIFIAVLAVSGLTNFSPVVFVLTAGALGVLIRMLRLDGESRKEAAK